MAFNPKASQSQCQLIKNGLICNAMMSHTVWWNRIMLVFPHSLIKSSACVDGMNEHGMSKCPRHVLYGSKPGQTTGARTEAKQTFRWFCPLVVGMCGLFTSLISPMLCAAVDLLTFSMLAFSVCIAWLSSEPRSTWQLEDIKWVYRSWCAPLI